MVKFIGSLIFKGLKEKVKMIENEWLWSERKLRKGDVVKAKRRKCF